MNGTPKLLIPALAALTISACVGGVALQIAHGTGPAATAAVSQPAAASGTADRPAAKTSPTGKVVKTEAEWKRVLTPAQFDVMRKQGTEAPFTSPLLNNHAAGTFRCVGCDNELFSSKTKFESGTGWPSFWAPIAEGRIRKVSDTSDGMERTEVVCTRRGVHLGHVFDDGPEPTHLRFCMNGVALKFVKAK